MSNGCNWKSRREIYDEIDQCCPFDIAPIIILFYGLKLNNIRWQSSVIGIETDDWEMLTRVEMMVSSINMMCPS